ncbi:hypothetical protein [Photobacterium damselae]|nr:hypothetical protein [Photobacterium damselae]
MLDNEKWDTVAEKVVAKDFYVQPYHGRLLTVNARTGNAR